jgi:thiamine-phosphate pyrophosphorylase
MRPITNRPQIHNLPHNVCEDGTACLITDGTALENERAWLDHAAAWIAAGVDLLQIREPLLTARQLCELTRKVMRLPNPHGTRILVNDRADVAIACGADGVHLKDGSVLPEFFARPGFLVSIACHTVADAETARGANLIILAPIFAPLSKEKSRPALGVEAITALARATSVPILALGGVTSANARLCLEAGAAGIAGISCFSGLPGGSAPSSVLP